MDTVMKGIQVMEVVNWKMWAKGRNKWRLTVSDYVDSQRYRYWNTEAIRRIHKLVFSVQLV
jgi:hypothetical protein